MKTFWLVLVSLVWGSTFFIVKDTVSSVNEHLIVFGRMLLAAVPMAIYVFVKNRKSLLNKKAIINGTILGFLLVASYLSQTIGLKYTSSGHSAFVTGTAVILVPIIMFIFYKYKFFKTDVLSIFIVLFGLFLLTYDFDTNINKGDIITLITVVTAAAHIVLSGRYVKNTDIMSMIAYQFISGAIFSLIGLFLWGDGNWEMSTTSMSAIIYLGFIGTLFCYFISVWVQKYVSSVRVALIFSLEPVFAAIFGFFALNEHLSYKEILGAFIIMIGVIMYSVLREIAEKKQSLAQA